jgi:hypothetical protein
MPAEGEYVDGFHRNVQARDFTVAGGYHRLEYLDDVVEGFAAGRDAGVAAVERDMD